MVKHGKIKRVREKKSRVKIVREVDREEVKDKIDETTRFDGGFVESAPVARVVPRVSQAGLDLNVEEGESDVIQRRVVREEDEFKPRSYAASQTDEENNVYYSSAQQPQRRIILERPSETSEASIFRDRVIRGPTGGEGIVQQNTNQFVERRVVNDEGAVSRYYESKEESSMRVKRKDKMF